MTTLSGMTLRDLVDDAEDKTHLWPMIVGRCRQGATVAEIASACGESEAYVSWVIARLWQESGGRVPTYPRVLNKTWSAKRTVRKAA